VNWGFQIIICIFIVTYVGVGNNTPQHTGVRRLNVVWNLIIYYAAIVLLSQITYQFAALQPVKDGLGLVYILNLLPLWIRNNLAIIGYQKYQDKDIWHKFFVYILYFAIGVYVRKEFNKWGLNHMGHDDDIELIGNREASQNSDMIEAYSDGK
jgi:hypothetical protein